jgi:hypothetical protein
VAIGGSFYKALRALRRSLIGGNHVPGLHMSSLHAATVAIYNVATQCRSVHSRANEADRAKEANNNFSKLI